MSYPVLQPSARTYVPGNWAVKTYNSMSGAEVRLLYGNKRFNASLRLEYSNITDAEAFDFLTHYNSQMGTYRTFTLPTEALAGWAGSTYIPNVSVMKYRYDGPPSVVQVRPGISTVSLELKGVV